MVQPGEALAALRPGGYGVFAWDAQEKLVLWAALEAIKGPHLDNILLGRVYRVQDIISTDDGQRWVGSDGSLKLPPTYLTIPEMIISGFALSNYHCNPDEEEVQSDKIRQLCNKDTAVEVTAKAKSLMHQISDWAPKR